MPMSQEHSSSNIKTNGAERLSSVVENYLLSLYILKEEQEKTVLGNLAAYIRRLPAAEGLGTSLPQRIGACYAACLVTVS